jgi:NAD(P)-dependent dehydrogenase (short-subunit alcohol dehydrogenase family)
MVSSGGGLLADDALPGIFGTLAPSHSLSTTDFDAINLVNYRGTWLCSRAELRQMLEQEPLPTHDGRPGNRGSIVNVASNLSLVSRTETRELCQGVSDRDVADRGA